MPRCPSLELRGELDRIGSSHTGLTQIKDIRMQHASSEPKIFDSGIDADTLPVALGAVGCYVRWARSIPTRSF
jgi:hypothetical protein